MHYVRHSELLFPIQTVNQLFITHSHICLLCFIDDVNHLTLLLESHSSCSPLFISVGEKQTAGSVKQTLWELLAQAGLRQDSSLWLQSYRHHLQAEGADEETQRKAMLLQLWATQVRE